MAMSMITHSLLRLRRQCLVMSCACSYAQNARLPLRSRILPMRSTNLLQSLMFCQSDSTHRHRVVTPAAQRVCVRCCLCCPRRFVQNVGPNVRQVFAVAHEIFACRATLYGLSNTKDWPNVCTFRCLICPQWRVLLGKCMRCIMIRRRMLVSKECYVKAQMLSRPRACTNSKSSAQSKWQHLNKKLRLLSSSH